jgi:outer membrane protein assembly factor BamB
VIYQSGPADELRARSADTGSVLWDRSGFQFDSIQQPVYADGVIWSMEESNLVAFDASNGDQLGFWYLAPATTLAVAEGHVFVPSPDGRLFILSPSA